MSTQVRDDDRPRRGRGLILTRQAGETLVIEGEGVPPIVLTVLAIRDGRARIAVSASRQVRVMRGELERGGGETFEARYDP